MAINQLGTFLFVEFRNAAGGSGSPELMQEMGEIIQRPGVNGSGVRKFGVKGEPFQMVSGVDCLNLSDGINTFNNYKSFVNQIEMRIIWNGVNYDDLNTRYIALDVKKQEHFPVLNAVGGLNGAQSAASYLVCAWTLLPVHYTGES